jgi:hypothetical protein
MEARTETWVGDCGSAQESVGSPDWRGFQNVSVARPRSPVCRPGLSAAGCPPLAAGFFQQAKDACPKRKADLLTPVTSSFHGDWQALLSIRNRPSTVHAWACHSSTLATGACLFPDDGREHSGWQTLAFVRFWPPPAGVGPLKTLSVLATDRSSRLSAREPASYRNPIKPGALSDSCSEPGFLYPFDPGRGGGSHLHR